MMPASSVELYKYRVFINGTNYLLLKGDEYHNIWAMVLDTRGSYNPFSSR